MSKTESLLSAASPVRLSVEVTLESKSVSEEREGFYIAQSVAC